jgi:hypothetical protein
MVVSPNVFACLALSLLILQGEVVKFQPSLFVSLGLVVTMLTVLLPVWEKIANVGKDILATHLPDVCHPQSPPILAILHLVAVIPNAMLLLTASRPFVLAYRECRAIP